MLNIKLAGKNKERELVTKKLLEALLNKYNLSKYFFTKDIIIEALMMPHSHPILTLNTLYLDDENKLLSLFLHEQMHWFEDSLHENGKKAILQFKKIYSDVPVGKNKGVGRNKTSTYEHIIVCFLQFEELSKIIGRETARTTISNMKGYEWIYEKVFKDYEIIKDILKKNNLLLN
jgi:hypothetical protein